MNKLILKYCCFVPLLLASCAAPYQYQGLDESKQFDSKHRDCPIEFVTKSPDAAAYVLIGRCAVKKENPFGAANNSLNKKAFEALHECACLNGGDLVFIEQFDEDIQNPLVGELLKLDAPRKVVESHANHPVITQVKLLGTVYKRKN